MESQKQPLDPNRHVHADRLLQLAMGKSSLTDLFTPVRPNTAAQQQIGGLQPIAAHIGKSAISE